MNPGPLGLSPKPKASVRNVCVERCYLPADATEARADPLTERVAGAVVGGGGLGRPRRTQGPSLLDEVHQRLPGGIEVSGHVGEDLLELLLAGGLCREGAGLGLQEVDDCLLGGPCHLVGLVHDLADGALGRRSEDHLPQLGLRVGEVLLLSGEPDAAVVAGGEIDRPLGNFDGGLGVLDRDRTAGPVLPRSLEHDSKIVHGEGDVAHVVADLDAVGGNDEPAVLHGAGRRRDGRVEGHSIPKRLVVEHLLCGGHEGDPDLAVDRGVDVGVGGCGLGLCHNAPPVPKAVSCG